MPRTVISYIKNGAIHIYRFTELISHVLFYLFDVNCAFLAVTDFAIAAKL